ncbi:putative amidoligase domain-containing protein [Paenibacillus faecalis]|uniref:putative amidoligase domain-containing protein n=1 Tax=Paenibacillus faecalis TaxID=2079532 RepID=UPI001F1CD305|nr:hypothetical protein [Paenibacillus faecalis]
MVKVLDELAELNKVEMLSSEKMDARLRRSGLSSRITWPLKRGAGRYIPAYRVKVRGMESAQVMLSTQGGNEAGWLDVAALPGGLEDGLHKRMEKAARRALYALGTDQGEVQIAALSGRRYAIERIVLNQESGVDGLSCHGMKDQVTRMENQAAFLMGMDPEFILVNREGDVVSASLYLDRNGVAGSDAVREGEEVSYPLAELRPAPQQHPDALLKSMRLALLSAKQQITDSSLLWKAGGMPVPGFPLGGHIHFSGVRISLPLLQSLDNYLALPLAILEDPSSRARRPRYGFLGDYRMQPHGGFEYRTLPSFLVSPFITKASLYMAYLIIHHHDKLRARPLNRERYHKAYYEGRVEVLQECAAKLHRDFALLPDYDRFAKVIDRVFAYIAEGRKWDESRDIRPLWNIPFMPVTF